VTPTIAILICTSGEIAPHWDLPGDPSIPLKMVGWRVSPEPVDEGVPAEVRSVIAEALVALGTVAFLSSRRDLVESRTHTITAASIRERTRAVVSGAPARLELATTDDPGTVQALFEDPAYPWTMRGQVVLLGRSLDPARIDWTFMEALLNDQWRQLTEQLISAGVEGVLRPGVDGDVLGFYELAVGFNEQAVAFLSHAARARGVHVESVPDAVFGRLLSRQ
jgi:hypothetical protein